jgi:hypothetical protein
VRHQVDHAEAQQATAVLNERHAQTIGNLLTVALVVLVLAALNAA